jgi:hypothetical protein
MTIEGLRIVEATSHTPQTLDIAASSHADYGIKSAALLRFACVKIEVQIMGQSQYNAGANW